MDYYSQKIYNKIINKGKYFSYKEGRYLNILDLILNGNLIVYEEAVIEKISDQYQKHLERLFERAYKLNEFSTWKEIGDLIADTARAISALNSNLLTKNTLEISNNNLKTIQKLIVEKLQSGISLQTSGKDKQTVVKFFDRGNISIENFWKMFTSYPQFASNTYVQNTLAKLVPLSDKVLSNFIVLNASKENNKLVEWFIDIINESNFNLEQYGFKPPTAKTIFKLAPYSIKENAKFISAFVNRYGMKQAEQLYKPFYYTPSLSKKNYPNNTETYFAFKKYQLSETMNRYPSKKLELNTLLKSVKLFNNFVKLMNMEIVDEAILPDEFSVYKEAFVNSKNLYMEYSAYKNGEIALNDLSDNILKNPSFYKKLVVATRALVQEETQKAIKDSNLTQSELENENIKGIIIIETNKLLKQRLDSLEECKNNAKFQKKIQKEKPIKQDEQKNPRVENFVKIMSTKGRDGR